MLVYAPSLDHHSRTLQLSFLRSRRAMLWAIHERKASKAATHAQSAARYVRLMLKRGALKEVEGNNIFDYKMPA